MFVKNTASGSAVRAVVKGHVGNVQMTMYISIGSDGYVVHQAGKHEFFLFFRGSHQMGFLATLWM